MTLRIPLPAREDDLADQDELELLGEIEDDLLDRLGPNAVFIGHETGQGQRTIYLHTAPVGPAADVIDAWRLDHGEYDVEVEVTHDPTWEILARW